MNIAKTMMAMASAAVMLLASSCDRNDQTEPAEPQLEVNANNISGKWELVKWNESALAEGTYVYMDIVRNGKTYTIYQNLDSFSNIPHVATGSYFIDTDVELGAIIRGTYDHDSGDWAHRYIVKSLTTTRMVWVAKDDQTYIQEFERIESIPVEED